MPRSRLLPLFLLSVALGGCETLGLSDPEPMSAEVIRPCPATAVLSDAVTVTKVKPGTPTGVRPDLSNIVYSAEMSQAQLDCDYDPGDNTLSVDIRFAIRASRGAAASGPDPTLDYFVAVVDIDNNILVKKVFQSRPNLGRRTMGEFRENVDNFVVPMEMDSRPYDYEILTGFQLTPAELALNRLPRDIPQLGR